MVCDRQDTCCIAGRIWCKQWHARTGWKPHQRLRYSKLCRFLMTCCCCFGYHLQHDCIATSLCFPPRLSTYRSSLLKTPSHLRSLRSSSFGLPTVGPFDWSRAYSLDYGCRSFQPRIRYCLSSDSPLFWFDGVNFVLPHPKVWAMCGLCYQHPSGGSTAFDVSNWFLRESSTFGNLLGHRMSYSGLAQSLDRDHQPLWFYFVKDPQRRGVLSWRILMLSLLWTLRDPFETSCLT